MSAEAQAQEEFDTIVEEVEKLMSSAAPVMDKISAWTNDDTTQENMVHDSVDRAQSTFARVREEIKKLSASGDPLEKRQKVKFLEFDVKNAVYTIEQIRSLIDGK